VIDRSGPNPAVYRQLATQRLHLYQVFGEPDDLVIAKQYLETALQASPADQWLVAQLAEIAIAEGDRDSATELISRANVLSEMGNNLERALYLQLLYRADPFGLRAASKPIRISAEERFLQHSP
jgi:Tfp pilus assembly protein PilF